MFKKVLALSPHTDDIEISAGGTIHKLLQQGSIVTIIAFSWCENIKLKEEFINSMKVMGVRLYGLKEFPRRLFYNHRQEILDFLWDIAQQDEPDLVIIPSTFDIHQDHQIICQESVRAFRNSSIWGFEISRNNISFQATCYSVLSDKDVLAKLEALKCYKTQEKRFDFRSGFHLSHLKSRGSCVQQEYAEAFEVIRLVHK